MFELKERTVVKLDPAILDSYAGTYDIEGFRVMLVHVDDHLVLRAPGQDDTILFAESDAKFFAKEDDVEIEVLPGAKELAVHFGPQLRKGKRV